MIAIRRVPWSRIELSDDYEEIDFEQINSKCNNKLIITTAQIVDIQTPQTQTEKVEYWCKHCTQPHYPEKILKTSEMEKYPCMFCGHKGLYEGNKKYKDIQEITVTTGNTKKQLKLFLEDQLVSYDKYHMHDTVRIYGIVRIVEKNGHNNQMIIQCRDIEIQSRMEDTVETDEAINRSSPEYNKWVAEIQNRDKVCQMCGGNKHLEAHHIYSYKNNPSLRTDVGNGVLLCTFCHSKFHSYYGKDVTPADLVRFMFQFKC